MSTPLYIIGNGFDLHHGMKTGYFDFKLFIQENYRECFDAVEEFLSIETSWSDFEEALGYLDVDHLIDYASNSLLAYSSDDWSDSAHHDYQYELNEKVKLLSHDLHEYFCEWLTTIEVKSNCPLLTIQNNAYFLTFNYTDALNKLYSIPHDKILHLHGMVDSPESDIILGHSWSPDERPQLASYVDESTDTRVAEGYDIVDDYFGKTYKPTNIIIRDNKAYFESLNFINEVYVLGHSISEVDFEYFRIIVTEINNNAKWYISYYSDLARNSLEKSIEKLDIDPVNVKFIRINETK